MNQQNSHDWQGLWAVTWRSIVFLPVTFGLFLLVLTLVFGIAVLPFYAMAYVSVRLPVHGAIALTVWIGLFWGWRLLRPRRWFEAPPSVL